LKIVSAKTLLKQWRIALIVSAVVAAVITPTSDPVNMGLMMLPLFALYIISIVFAVFANPNKKPRKKMSKRARIIFLILSILLIGGIIYLYMQYPKESVELITQITSTIVTWWKTLTSFFSSLIDKLGKIT